MRNSMMKKKIMAIAASAVMSVTAVTGTMLSAVTPFAGNITTTFAAEASVKVMSCTGYAEGMYATWGSVSGDRKSTRLNSSHISKSRMPSSA